MCANCQAKQTTLTFLAYICPKNRLVIKLMSKWESASSRYHVCQFSGKTNNFDFIGLNLLKYWLWGWSIKNLSLDLESALPRDHMCQFSVKMDNFEFFGLHLGKLLNHVQCFGHNNAERVLQKAERRCMELGGGWNELGGGGYTI